MEKNKGFKVTGIKVRTQNDGAAQKDIPLLWSRFMSADLAARIPNKLSEDIYCVYTNYYGNHLDPYDTLIGYKVDQNAETPENLFSVDIPEQKTKAFLAKGPLHQGEAVIKKWQEIWQQDLNRSFGADYEVYGQKSMNMDNAEVDIYISVN